MSARKKSESGFSLIEVLIALALMAVIILAVMGLVTAGMHRAYGGKKMTEAAVLAQAVLERVNQPAAQNLINSTNTSDRSVTWSNNGTVTPAAEGTTAGAERDRWRSLFANAPLPTNPANPTTMTVRVEAVPAGSTWLTAAMIRITVDVMWRERGTRARHVRLQTLNRPSL